MLWRMSWGVDLSGFWRCGVFFFEGSRRVLRSRVKNGATLLSLSLPHPPTSAGRRSRRGPTITTPAAAAFAPSPLLLRPVHLAQRLLPPLQLLGRRSPLSLSRCRHLRWRGEAEGGGRRIWARVVAVAGAVVGGKGAANGERREVASDCDHRSRRPLTHQKQTTRRTITAPNYLAVNITLPSSGSCLCARRDERAIE